MSAFLSFILFITYMFGLNQKTLDNNFYYYKKLKELLDILEIIKKE